VQRQELYRTSKFPRFVLFELEENMPGDGSSYNIQLSAVSPFRPLGPYVADITPSVRTKRFAGGPPPAVAVHRRQEKGTEVESAQGDALNQAR
jgi:hypothetical protein